MRLTTPVPDQVIDLSGRRCPHLVFAIIDALGRMNGKQILQVITTDPVAPSSVTSWTRQSGHTLLDVYEDRGRFVFFVECATLRVQGPVSPEPPPGKSTRP